MGRTIELVSVGADEFLQNQGGDPWGSASSFGLRVPTLATPDKTHRYLFLGASFSIGHGDKARIVGYRQFSSLGIRISQNRFVEQEITSPNFRLPDGNISWALRRLGPPNTQGLPTNPTNLDLDSFKRDWADGPCLLYESYAIAPGNRIYPQLTFYKPPLLGRPWGTPLRAGLQGDFFDQRTPWRDAHAWSSLDVELEGPDTIAMFCSVRQSRGTYALAASSPLAFPEGLSPEESFCGNFGLGTSDAPHPIYWRVGCSLIVETEPRL
jgi:hypothetical protein